ncbi:MAG: 1-acyl-sn-glycerol-3-phosphate acyltransferase [Synechococcaceae cyanobacterium SM2_3_2]|nr:1-acyl-sn-glycerol-3-phosphate acyltransferase [Synechococcaceae cyanobacterium SM2_3_2]
MDSMTTAQPPLQFIPPAYNPWAYRLVKWIGPLWLRQRIYPITADGLDTLVDCYQQFEAGHHRFVLAYRHPTNMDPYCLMYTLTQLVPQAAKARGIRLKKAPNSHFLYDRGVHLWLGSLGRWMLPSLGGISIQRGKLDRPALRASRELFLNGEWPLAIAPEGAINGHNRILNPLEPGVAQLSYWCLEDLHKAGRDHEDVVILPIGIRYTYHDDLLPPLQDLLSQLEKDCGLPSLPLPNKLEPDKLEPDKLGPESMREQHLYVRMLRVGDALLATLETFYRAFYPDVDADELATHLEDPRYTQGIQLPELAETVKTMRIRLARLLDVALQVAERRLQLKVKGNGAKGNLVERRHAVEQAGWDRIFRADIPDLETLSPIERGLADRLAQEADLHLWHMRLAETFTGIIGQTVDLRPPQERLVETTLHLWEVVSRIKGEDPLGRRTPHLGRKSAHLTIGDPISVSSRWPEYQSNRRQAMSDLLADVQRGLEKTLRSEQQAEVEGVAKAMV